MDIIVLILLCYRMGNIVKPKGYSPAVWQLYTVLVWVGGELLGMMISFNLGKSLTVMIISGLLCAVLAYLMLQSRAYKLVNKATEEQ